MTHRIVLAYSGSLASSVAVEWLTASYAAEIVTVTLDVGQTDDLEAVRGRALSCGAVRAHVVDVREEFARDHLLPSLQAQGGTLDACSLIAHLTHPLIARTLLEIAAIEEATAVAHVSVDDAADLDGRIARLDPSMRVIAAARQWQRDGIDVVAYARAHEIPVLSPGELPCDIEQNLGGRLVTWTDSDQSSSRPGVYKLTTDLGAAPDEGAYVELAFEEGMPLTVNCVPMSSTELLESLSTIAGRHGVGRAGRSSARLDGSTWRQACEAPAVTVLHAAYEARRQGADVVRLKLFKGEATVVPSGERQSGDRQGVLVSQA